MLDMLKLEGPLNQAMGDLKAANKKILIGLDGLDFGLQAYRGEHFSVLDVYKHWIGAPVCVLATTVPGRISKPIFDHRVEVEVPEEVLLDDVQQ